MLDIPVKKPKTQRKLLMNHLPKCAGNAMGASFKVALGEDKVHEVSRPDLIGLGEALEINLSDYEFIFGHFSLGQENMYPAYPRRFTVMREPVSRMLSAAGFLQKLKDTNDPVAALLPSLTLRDYVFSAEPLIREATWNQQSRQLLGYPSYGEMSETDAEELVRSRAGLLERFDLMGIYEELQATYDLIAWRFELPRFDSRLAVNVTGDRRNLDIEPDIREEILRANRVDVALYNYAAQRFRADVDRMHGDLIARHYFAAHHDERPAEVDEKGGATTIELSGPTPGSGWYTRSVDRNGRAYRWAVGGSASQLYLWQGQAPILKIRIFVAAWASGVSSQDLTVSVDGEPRPFRLVTQRTQGAIIVLWARFDPKREGRVVSIRSRKWREPVPEDGRSLVFGVRQVVYSA